MGGEGPSASGQAAPSRQKQLFPIVGVGASAGGLKAFMALLKSLPPDTGMAFVLVQHLAPDHPSSLADILSRSTKMPVAEVTDEPEVAPNRVYVIPPGRNMILKGTKLKLIPRDRAGPHGANHPVDRFFNSLSESRREGAIGVVLSGTATDGTLGLEEIKGEGGITFAQDDTAEHDGMPQSAISSGCVDFILPPEGIAAELARIARHPYVAGRALGGVGDGGGGQEGKATAQSGSGAQAGSDGGGRRAEPDKGPLAPILSILLNVKGVDFSGYRASTLHRRIHRRMVLCRADGLEAYAKLLREDRAQVESLYQDILINVTGFFRDPEMFTALKAEALPNLFKAHAPGAPLRIWVLGCSTGEEAYSLAMMASEAAPSEWGNAPAQVFATDLNDVGIGHARAGVYSAERMRDVSPERIRQFFREEHGKYRVSKFIRDMCVFARHNVLGDPPFSRMDIISCRNLLIYLEPELQQRIIPVLHYALRPAGCLVLGGSETVGASRDLFHLESPKHKIYIRRSGRTRHVAPALPGPRPGSTAGAGAHAEGDPDGQREQGTRGREGGGRGGDAARLALAFGGFDMQKEADRLLLSRFAPPGVLVDENLNIVQFRGNTEPWLTPAAGKASLSVLKMAREGLLVSLRSLLHRAGKENASVREEGVRVMSQGAVREVNIEVTPVRAEDAPGAGGGYLVLFEQTEARRQGDRGGDGAAKGREGARGGQGGGASAEAGDGRAEELIAGLERELANAREHRQSLLEQHDAAMEELQSANEEAQSANEELQSINEELETSKEEIESSNEELTTVNDELQHRTAEMAELNGDLINLIGSVDIAIIIIGRDLRIRRFSPMAQKSLGVLPSDTGRPVTDIRLGIEMDGSELESLLEEVIDSVVPQEREVRDRHGRWHALRIRPYKTVDNRIDGAVMMLVDIDGIRQARDYAHAILGTVRDPLVVLGGDLRIHTANAAFYRVFKTEPSAVEGRMFHEIGNHHWDDPRLLGRLHDILPRNSFFDDFELTRDFDGIGRRTMLLDARSLREPEAGRRQILLGIQDVTEMLQFQRQLRESERRYRRLFESARDGIALLDMKTGAIVDANPFFIEMLGVAQDQIVGKELFEIGLLESQSACQTLFRTLEREGAAHTQASGLPGSAGRHRLDLVTTGYEDGERYIVQCHVRPDPSPPEVLGAE